MDTTKEQLALMLERYEIGKKPLSRLLGWGDTTVMRYLDGVEPNREFAKRIEELAENPWEYAWLLEQNKEKLTEVAYKKTKKAVQREIFCDRSTEAMQYVIELAKGDIAPYRVITVLYYAQVCSLVLRGLPLFEEEVDFSPGQFFVYPRIYQLMMQYGIRRRMPEISSFSEEEQEYLTAVYQILNSYGPNALKALFVREKRRIRKHLKSGADRLLADALKEQYEAGFRKLEINSAADVKKYLTYALRKTESDI